MENSAGLTLDSAVSSALLPPYDPARRASELYAEIGPALEGEFNGQYVAIHPETQSYIVERRPGRAFRALREKQPYGSIVVHNIGFANFGLKARLCGEQPR